MNENQRRKAAYMRALYRIRDMHREEFDREYQKELEKEFGGDNDPRQGSLLDEGMGMG